MKNPDGFMCKPCPRGRWSNLPRLDKVALCRNCAAGLWSDSIGAASSKACVQCESGYFSVTVGALSSEACNVCPQGFSQPEPGRAYCLPCAPGKSQNRRGQARCAHCPSQYFAAKSTQHGCQKCPVGRNSGIGSATCSQCLPGTHVSPANDTCRDCPAGWFTDKTEQYACTKCELGRKAKARSTVCSQCLPGRYVSSFDNTCLDCANGFYSQGTESSSCQKCEAGRGTVNTGSTFCSICAKGKRSTSGGKCNPCDVDTYQPLEKQTTCLACEMGTYTDNTTGSAMCEKIPRPVLVAPEKVSILAVDDYTIEVSWTWKNGGTEISGFEIQVGIDRQFIGKISVPAVSDGPEARSTRISRQVDHRGRDGDGEDDVLLTRVLLWQHASLTFVQVRVTTLDPSWSSPWSLATEPWKLAAECTDSQYLNTTFRDPTAWNCMPCPKGASCRGSVVWRDVKALHGWWRAPWSHNNATFEVCPYVDDCLGARPAAAMENTMREYDGNLTTAVAPEEERCRSGTEGPLCSICQPGHNRDILTCVKCRNESFLIRVGLFVAGLGVSAGLAFMCRRSLTKRWKRIKPFWMDFLRILNLMVTFAQINSSLPSVIEIQWPSNFVAFVAALNFVNIDVLSLIGASCIGNFDFRVSFCIMQLLPLSVLALAITEFKCSRRSDRIKLSKMTSAERKSHYAEALRVLFQLADNDNSGCVDPTELSGILKQLGWPTKVHVSREIMAATVGAQMDKNGMLHSLPERAFVTAMANGRILDALTRKNVTRRRTRTVLIKKKSLANPLGVPKMVRETQATLNTEDRLVAWTLRRQHAATAFSGAVQLLLLAHTPVSTKVFQWFHCNDIAGRTFLRADVSQCVIVVPFPCDRYRMEFLFVVPSLTLFSYTL